MEDRGQGQSLRGRCPLPRSRSEVDETRRVLVGVVRTVFRVVLKTSYRSLVISTFVSPGFLHVPVVHGSTLVT